MPEEKLFCKKCNRTMAPVKFYAYRDGTKCELCKECLTMHVNTYDESTYLWIMEKFDIPYIPSEWKRRREAEFEKAYAKAAAAGAKDPQKAAYDMTRGNSAIVGKYISQMKLSQWLKYHWADTERLKEELEAKKIEQAERLANDESLAHYKEDYEKGLISEAEYLTYLGTDEKKDIPMSLEEQFLAEGGPDRVSQVKEPEFKQVGGGGVYPVNDHPYEEIEIIDVGQDLTQEDKIYLAMKWGQLYTAADWVRLEKLYKEFEETFDIQGAARIDTLKMICKTSLKMNQAIDAGDIDSYQKLSRVYDSMMKSAKFTEAQKKEDSNGDFDAVGQIVYFAETAESGGAIPRHKIDTPLDLIDEAIDNIKRYVRELIDRDSSLSQQIENYIKRRENAEAAKEDQLKAKAMGLEQIELSDQDIIDFQESLIEEDEEEDDE